MFRTAYGELEKWKEKPDRRPLIIRGVRQCGKTYLIKEFGEKNYDDVAYFNFEGNNPLMSLFEQDLDIDRIVEELGIYRNKVIRPETTLIVFDEVQFCNKALTSLKYFYENRPQYHIICAGSLLGIALSKPLSFPVGKVDMLMLYPMSFYEFLLANGEEMLLDHLKKLSADSRISDLFSAKLEQLLKNYYLTGGMPEVVDKWIKNRDIEEIESVQQRILDSYELDFAKHAPHSEYPKLSLIWRSIPEQLAKENRKFIFSHVKKGLRAKQLEDALEWLVNAGLAYKVEKISEPYIPLSAYSDKTYFKLYMSDIGLLRKMAGVPVQALYEKNPLYTHFKGALTENYVLQELICFKREMPYYWKSGNMAEVDFIIREGMDIVPIEVKAESNTRAKSLSEYRKKYNPRIAVKLSMNNVRGKNVREIPLYMVWRLYEYIKP